jgi:hypothetical protein
LKRKNEDRSTALNRGRLVLAEMPFSEQYERALRELMEKGGWPSQEFLARFALA